MRSINSWSLAGLAACLALSFVNTARPVVAGEPGARRHTRDKQLQAAARQRHERDALEIREMPERNRFMKGLFAWSGFRQAAVEYERAPRTSGSTKFRYWKLWQLALDGLTSASTMPLRVWSYIGVVIAFFTFLYAVYVIAKTILFGSDVAGYPSLMVAILFFGGLQLISLGVLGEYVGRILIETKRRPLYVVRRKIGFPDGAEG